MDTNSTESEDRPMSLDEYRRRLDAAYGRGNIDVQPTSTGSFLVTFAGGNPAADMALQTPIIVEARAKG